MPGSGPYIIQLGGNPREHFVPLEQTGDTLPGKPGDYSMDTVNRKVVYYTGDGQTHSWGTTELVACSRA